MALYSWSYQLGFQGFSDGGSYTKTSRFDCRVLSLLVP